MDKFILITGDYNDGDYTTKETPISDEEIVKIKEIIRKMPKDHSCIRYETREIGNDDKEDSDYSYISNEEKLFLERFLPTGDPNYTGIHTIESIEIIKKLEKIL